jgi:hypothetical protein
VMEFLPIYAQDPPLISGLSKQSPAVVFGVFLIIVVFLAPSGIAGLVRRLVSPLVSRVVRQPGAAATTPAVVHSRRAEL